MDAGLLASKLTLHRANGLALPSVVIPVHFGGQSCDMRAIHMLAQEFGFRVIEDASHAAGALYQNKPVGDCRFSDICVFSFHPVKIITTGEGGMLTTQDPLLARRLQQLRSHGITRDASEMHQQPDGPWYYEQIALGLNYRMTDIQAALGASQLGRLTHFLARRREIASHYEREFNGFAGMQTCPNYTESARHLFPIRVPAGKRRVIFEALRQAGLGVNVHYIPIYLQPHYRALGFPQGLCPKAEAYYQEAISLPIHAGLADSELAQVVDAVKGKVPVVAAGGIFDGRGLIASLALGAEGVWIGTKFIATHEAHTGRGYKEKMLEMAEDDTVISKAYTGKTCRVARTEWTQHFEEHPEELQGFPGQAIATIQAGIHHLGVGPEVELDTNRAFMAIGQSVGAIDEIKPARQVVAEIMAEAIETLERLNSMR
jgi:dTDP-4-amino-4,6-dideoxygalactose transaminase